MALHLASPVKFHIIRFDERLRGQRLPGEVQRFDQACSPLHSQHNDAREAWITAMMGVWTAAQHVKANSFDLGSAWWFEYLGKRLDECEAAWKAYMSFGAPPCTS